MTKEELSRPSVTSLFKNQGIVLFVIGVAAYGAVTANKKIILTQGGPAILAILSILLFK